MRLHDVKATVFNGLFKTVLCYSSLTDQEGKVTALMNSGIAHAVLLHADDDVLWERKVMRREVLVFRNWVEQETLRSKT